jgi:primosomal protein N' (replication factor Y) (superfamily II helicase)
MAMTSSDMFDETPSGRVSVVLPLRLEQAFDYRVPTGAKLEPGDYVTVPLGRRVVIGVVWDRPSTVEDIEDGKLKSVIERIDLPPLPAVHRKFLEWVAAYTLSPLGTVLRMTLGRGMASGPPKPKMGYVLGGPEPDRMTPARERVLALVADRRPRALRDLAREAAVGPGVVKGLIDAGTLTGVELPARLGAPAPDWSRPGPQLSDAQAAAAAELRHKMSAGEFSVTVLDGVTGSGKTEVYFDAIVQALEAGHQILVLLPEIGLTSQWLERFESRFGAAPDLWHSDLTVGQRKRTWRAVADGSARVVVGARSALFLPFQSLGLIVVDEEHDPSFKQEEGVIYQARDMAVVRASLGGLAITLASATPALETVVNMTADRYRRVHLPDRYGGARLPDVLAVDMRKDPPARGSWVSPPLAAAIEHTVARGEQAMLFLNRRGYAPLTLCRTCGHRLQCPDCSAWLVEHRHRGRSQCHHCGHTVPLPKICPECSDEDSLVACGPGVERLAEEVATQFPDLRYAIMSSDNMTGPNAVGDLIGKVERHEIDLLIGTQIMAKGHHFPLLTLVGVIDADLGLAGGDLRAAERTYQLLFQVSGRAGRAERPGQVVLQTYFPEHPVMTALLSGDRDGFIEREIEARRNAGMPPFGRLAAVIVSGLDPTATRETAQALAKTAPRGQHLQVLGPAPAPLSLLRGRHRWRLLLKAERSIDVPETVRRWLDTVPAPHEVRVRADIDPYSFL